MFPLSRSTLLLIPFPTFVSFLSPAHLPFAFSSLTYLTHSLISHPLPHLFSHPLAHSLTLTLTPLNNKDWREEYHPETIRTDKESIEIPLKAGVVFWHKHDKQGRPCLVIQAAKHLPRDTTPEITERCCAYLLEKGVAMYA